MNGLNACLVNSLRFFYSNASLIKSIFRSNVRIVLTVVKRLFLTWLYTDVKLLVFLSLQSNRRFWIILTATSLATFLDCNSRCNVSKMGSSVCWSKVLLPVKFLILSINENEDLFAINCEPLFFSSSIHIASVFESIYLAYSVLDGLDESSSLLYVEKSSLSFNLFDFFMF